MWAATHSITDIMWKLLHRISKQDTNLIKVMSYLQLRHLLRLGGVLAQHAQGHGFSPRYSTEKELILP